MKFKITKKIGLILTAITATTAVGVATITITSPNESLTAAKHNVIKVKTQSSPVRPPGIRPRDWKRGVGQTYPSPQHVPYTETGTKDTRPNILFITTDDESTTDMKWMPKTRHWLQKEGITFNNMLSPHPLCCPARAEMMTGEYAQNNGVHTNAGPYGGLPALIDPDNTLPWWLQQTHYLTGMAGKYLNDYHPEDGVPRGWDHWNAATHNSFGYYDYVLYNDGQPKLYDRSSDENNSSTVITNDTINMINTWSKDERPWFIWSSYYAPHGLCTDSGGCSAPPEPSYKYRHIYKKAKSPSMAKPSYNEKDVTDKPHVIAHQNLKKNGRERFLFLERIRSLKTVDDGVDATMKALQKNGELDNTLIIFTSDNGYLVGEHRYNGKILPYEEAVKVPLLMRGPGLPQNESRNQTVTMVDIASTILDETGATAGRIQDGHSMLPYARSRTLHRPDDTILIQAGGTPDRTPTPWMYRGVRTSRYTYVSWKYGFKELYDRKKDPYELTNIAKNQKYQQIRRILASRLKVLKNCSGADCQQAFGPVPDPS